MSPARNRPGRDRAYDQGITSDCDDCNDYEWNSVIDRTGYGPAIGEMHTGWFHTTSFGGQGQRFLLEPARWVTCGVTWRQVSWPRGHGVAPIRAYDHVPEYGCGVAAQVQHKSVQIA